ncbi:branch point binding protein, putative [Trypanosoma equiperdum]|uniref:Branch point binding protein, putative n=4 Tax=Trypanozoon TaxID=39700 RepID=Q38A35_TRYB2|nr:branch point binding protein, putative [Trypanosoma brucei gambiense DAL972]XP_823163.1 branch point binding protein, putative [Trypanosoma brucei brucei TREU927]RHW69238.1 branch point binding protein [Trypanosoma brucei equiperdum]SCU65446.1 branch point binding protein, putative [Trypanosoma equiperdum]EAN78335.1 branch point binding protein, putative [Trypanosoma brucei brucei TREU927]CBH16054.1 branch point binding protein, putative [Trypanosoma brucei gambiense DAL972]|eukprot:XP_011778318.1 branch point binding protein, putative [Trypanosoma brucei gambiense DAL972]
MGENRRPSRWSSERYTNLFVPNYIPPELMLYDEGQFLRAFLLRVLSIDLNRLIETKRCGDYFINIPLVPEYNSEGQRTNTPDELVAEKRLKVMDELTNLLRQHSELELNAKTQKEVVRKRYFTQEEMDNGAYGAILGARGMVHQELERLTKCKIVLAGRGITNALKDTSANAARVALEDPHARITAPNEQALQHAMERIEWILSDDPEALEFRENNRKRMAQIEGRYDPRTWVSLAERNAKNPRRMGEKREREEEAKEELDADLQEFLDEL